MEEQLEVVNENGEVIDLKPRSVVHQEGLLHREIHVWFMTPNREIIFQHRAKDKETYPDKLDATVGGHVEPGDSYEGTALKESKEDTGVDLDPSKLKLVGTMRKRAVDEATGLTNNVISAEYAYLFEGNIDDLQVEEGKAIGFEVWRTDVLPILSETERERFIALFLSEEFLSLFKRGQEMLDIKNTPI